MATKTADRIDHAVAALRDLDGAEVSDVGAIIDRLIAARRRYCDDPRSCMSCAAPCRAVNVPVRYTCGAADPDDA